MKFWNKDIDIEKPVCVVTTEDENFEAITNGNACLLKMYDNKLEKDVYLGVAANRIAGKRCDFFLAYHSDYPEEDSSTEPYVFTSIAKSTVKYLAISVGVKAEDITVEVYSINEAIDYDDEECYN